ncbi:MULTISPECIES: hypothetical protein [unclassified Exiguobacterium]|uniref:hypothetical protein n=1 Tax=unclassified Exiguobacterium TaxID=2644629 RepID=UPI0025C27664|nr:MULTISPECIES: hypothetical protein [unclassified Exiguobacterium]
MAEKRYTVVFDAKDMASARLSEIERNARGTSRSLSELTKETDEAVKEAKRLEGAYRDANGRLRDANGRFLKTKETIRDTNNEINRSGSFLSRMGAGFNRMGAEGRGMVGRLSEGLGGIVGTLGSITAAAGIATTALLAMGAKGVWDNIIKPAMDVESTKLQIDALSGSPEKGSEIYKMSRKFGMASTYSNEDIMGGTFAFMQNTKDTGQLKEMLGITERLAALNTEEGFRGASFSLKEAMSGDITSIAERFNVGKKALRENGFDANADWQTNLQAVNKTLDGIGIDDKFVEKIRKSAPAQLARLEKNVRTSFASMGNGMVKELKPAFQKVNTLFEDEKGLNKFTSAMSGKFRGALQDVFGLGDGVEITWKDITEWSTETFDGLKDVLKSSGKTFKSFVEILTGTDLKKPGDAFDAFGKTLSGIAKKIDSIREGMEQIDKLGDKFGKATGIGQKGGMQKQIDDGAWWLPEGAKGGRGLLGYLIEGMPSERMKKGDKHWFEGSHALGLSYVPHDNYRANLHEGERVLTRTESRDYSKMLSSGERVLAKQEDVQYATGLMTPNIPVVQASRDPYLPPAPTAPASNVQNVTNSQPSLTVNLNGGVTIREEADINKIGQQIAREFVLMGAKQ